MRVALLECPSVSLARAARPRLCRVREPGAVALRELSGGLTPAAGADAAARRRRVRLCARRRRLRRRRHATRPRSARRGCEPGRRACTRPSVADALRKRRHGGRSRAATAAYDLMFVALGHSIRSLNLPVSLFDDLLSAFGQDTMTTRYDSWHDVLDYCRRSANPVGRLVLRIAGRGDRRARSFVGRALHGAAVDQLLAGLRPRLARRPACTCRARCWSACGAHEADLGDARR